MPTNGQFAQKNKKNPDDLAHTTNPDVLWLNDRCPTYHKLLKRRGRDSGHIWAVMSGLSALLWLCGWRFLVMSASTRCFLNILWQWEDIMYRNSRRTTFIYNLWLPLSRWPIGQNLCPDECPNIQVQSEPRFGMNHRLILAVFTLSEIETLRLTVIFRDLNNWLPSGIRLVLDGGFCH